MTKGCLRIRWARALPALILTTWVGCGDDPVGTGPVDAETFDVVDASEDPLFEPADRPDAAGDSDRPDGVDDPEAEADAPADAEDATDEPDFDPGSVDEAQPVAFDPNAVDPDDDLFPLGVQAGAMRPDSVLLWTYASDRATKHLRVWRPSREDGEVLMVHDERAVPSDDGYFHVPVDGLAPGTVYHYAFLSGSPEAGFDARSLIGRVRTALAPGTLEPLTVGGASCTNQFYAPWQALRRLADVEMDLFVHTGDMSYNDSATTLEEYRESWRDTLDDPGYRALFAATGMYATWDDHEVTNDFDPDTVDPERVETARTALYETQAREPGVNGALWQSYQWGDTAEVIVLDCRSERQPSTRSTDDAIYISRDQMDWLKQRLLDSSAHFKLILNSVPITNMPFLWDLAADDRWEGYAAQRDELLDFIVDQNIRNVWFLSGDFHVGFVSTVEPSGPRARIHEIALGPAGNGPNPLQWTLIGVDQFPYSSGETEAYTLLTFDPLADQVHVRFVNDAGTVLLDQTFSETP